MRNEPPQVVDLSEYPLLDLFLSCNKEQREANFASTARVAELTGLSVRTIQSWIDIGQVQAVRIGKKYQIHMDSLKEALKRQTSMADRHHSRQ